MPEVVMTQCDSCRLIASMPARLYGNGKARCGVGGCRGLLIRERWREKRIERNARGHQQKRRPEPCELSPVEGSSCERCGDLTPEIACLFVDYWLCPKCVVFFEGLARYAKLTTVSKASGTGVDN